VTSWRRLKERHDIDGSNHVQDDHQFPMTWRAVTTVNRNGLSGLPEHELQLDRLKLKVALALELSVYREDVVLKTKLQPVPSIEEQSNISFRKFACESAHRLIELTFVNIASFDDSEAARPQRFGNIACIIEWIGEPRRVRVGTIAHHQGDALFRHSWPGGDNSTASLCALRLQGGSTKLL
jgi:hypothetical protein